jgi:Uma2 family endonuclease
MLMAATEATQLMTAEDLLQLPSGMGQRYELVEGDLKTMSPAGSRHGRIALRVGALLQQFVRSHGLGETVGAETGFILRRNPDTVRAPDAGFIAKARIPATGLPDGFFPGAPDLAVEVVSPNDGAAEVLRKVSEFFEAGAQQVWVVYPELRRVAVFLTMDASRVLAANDTLDGGTLLPGFTCPVAELFE